MSTTNQANPSTARTIRIQRATIVVLLTSTIALLAYARAERVRASRWRTEALRCESQQSTEPITASSDYYPVTAIREDGSSQPVDAKALRIDLGEGRLLDVPLRRNDQGWLGMWAPFKHGDTHANVVVFRPHAANAYSLELDRISLKFAPGATFAEQAPDH